MLPDTLTIEFKVINNKIQLHVDIILVYIYNGSVYKKKKLKNRIILF